MPTFIFTRTREQLRDGILRKLGVLARGETADSEDANIVYEAMDLRLKEMHAKGVLWMNVSAAASNLILVASTATVAAAADVLFPVTVSVVVNNKEKPLEIIGHRQYQAITDKAEEGEPELVFFSGGTYYFWPVPAIGYTGKHTYEQIAADTVASTAPDVQVGMLRSFKNVVAYDLVDDFMVSDQIKIARMKTEADDGMRTIYALNRERSDAGTTEAEYF
jgi:hypothetical protein